MKDKTTQGEDDSQTHINYKLMNEILKDIKFQADNARKLSSCECNDELKPKWNAPKLKMETHNTQMQ